MRQKGKLKKRNKVEQLKSYTVNIMLERGTAYYKLAQYKGRQKVVGKADGDERSGGGVHETGEGQDVSLKQ